MDAAAVAARLCEVGADGTSVLVSKGILNATRREGMADPVPLSDTPMQLDFHFVSTPFLPTPEPASHGLPAARQEGTCWKLAKGHQLRLSINGSDFPNVWPTPCKCDIVVHWGEGSTSSVGLPLWDGGEPLHRPLPPSPLPAVASAASWSVSSDLMKETHTLVVADAAVGGRLEASRAGAGGEFGVSDLDPAVAWATNVSHSQAQWPGVDVHAETTGTLTSTAQSFDMSLGLRVLLNGELFFTRSWSESVPRLLM